MGLFAPEVGHPRAGLRVPQRLFSPTYGPGTITNEHRPHQTIVPLAQRLGIRIDDTHEIGDEAATIGAVLGGGKEPVLIAWEHRHIPNLAHAIPLVRGTRIPAAWPPQRFDVVWKFELDPATKRYRFSQQPELLLAGDKPTGIALHNRRAHRTPSAAGTDRGL